MLKFNVYDHIVVNIYGKLLVTLLEFNKMHLLGLIFLQCLVVAELLSESFFFNVVSLKERGLDACRVNVIYHFTQMLKLE